MAASLGCTAQHQQQHQQQDRLPHVGQLQRQAGSSPWLHGRQCRRAAAAGWAAGSLAGGVGSVLAAAAASLAWSVADGNATGNPHPAC
jgi:hypothetical protein